MANIRINGGGMSISVLQSVYKKDNPHFLDETFESLYNQTLKADEIILVRDGTIGEDLEEIINKWVTKLPLKVIGYDQNHGLAYAKNYGLQFVTSDYIVRMDSDDICYPERFKEQLQEFEKYPEICICGTGLSEFYNTKDCCSIRLYPEMSDKNSKKLFKGTPVAHPTVMIKTEILKKYKYDERLRKSQDLDLWFRILKDGYIIRTIQKPLLYFRITDETFKRRNISKAFMEFRIYTKYLFNFFGINLLYIYPIARLFSRLLPGFLIKRLYFSESRKKILK